MFANRMPRSTAVRSPVSGPSWLESTAFRTWMSGLPQATTSSSFRGQTHDMEGAADWPRSGFGDAEGHPDGLCSGTRIERTEVFDLEGAADTVARGILEDGERQQVVGAGLPRLRGREAPLPFTRFD